ncbi:hypothetical protein BO443_50424 [Burkholderia orbicola]
MSRCISSCAMAAARSIRHATCRRAERTTDDTRCRRASRAVAAKTEHIKSALAQTSGETAGQRIDVTSKRHQHPDSDQAEPRSYQKQIHGHTTVLS